MCNSIVQPSLIQHSLMGVAIATLSVSTFFASPGLASSTLTQIDAALNYPTAAERFFDEGQQQFEQEVQRLSEPSPNTTETLRLDESLLDTSQQQRLRLEQPDGRSQDRELPLPLDAF